MCQKSKQHAPQGQKPIAQGNTLGKSITNTNAPCRGKSVNYQCFCPCRAFCCFQSVHPRCCLGLCAFWAFSPSSLITIQDCTIQNRRRSREQFKIQNSKFKIAAGNQFKIVQFKIAGVAENNSKFKTQNSKFASRNIVQAVKKCYKQKIDSGEFVRRIHSFL